MEMVWNGRIVGDLGQNGLTETTATTGWVPGAGGSRPSTGGPSCCMIEFDLICNVCSNVWRWRRLKMIEFGDSQNGLTETTRHHWMGPWGR
jgi:hypothetical protein